MISKDYSNQFDIDFSNIGFFLSSCFDLHVMSRRKNEDGDRISDEKICEKVTFHISI